MRCGYARNNMRTVCPWHLDVLSSTENADKWKQHIVFQYVFAPKCTTSQSGNGNSSVILTLKVGMGRTLWAERESRSVLCKSVQSRHPELAHTQTGLSAWHSRVPGYQHERWKQGSSTGVLLGCGKDLGSTVLTQTSFSWFQASISSGTHATCCTVLWG